MNLNELTKKEIVQLLEFVHSSARCCDDDGLRDLLKRLNALVPFKSASVLFKTEKGKSGSAEIIEFNINYPAAYGMEYSACGHSLVDPLVKECMGVDKLVYWGDALAKHGIAPGLLDLADDFGFRNACKGWGYCHGLKNFRNTGEGLIAFYGMKRSEHSELILKLAVPHIQAALTHARRRPSKGMHLSFREKEILQWTAQGKSTWDISKILNISERTVNFHIDNIKIKLDAVNRTHAVAVAMRMGLMKLE